MVFAVNLSVLMRWVTYVTRSREMSHLSKISISIFLHNFLKTSKCFILMQTPLQLDIWIQSYEWFDNAKNIMKQKEFEHCFCQYLKSNIPDIGLIPLDHVTYFLALIYFFLQHAKSWKIHFSIKEKTGEHEMNINRQLKTQDEKTQSSILS